MTIPRAACGDVPAIMVVYGVSPANCSAGVPFSLNEPEEVVCEMQPCEKKRKFGDGGRSHVVDLTCGMMTEIGFSEMDAMVCQGASTKHFGAPPLGGEALGIEISPKKELCSNEKFSQRSKV